MDENRINLAYQELQEELLMSKTRSLANGSGSGSPEKRISPSKSVPTLDFQKIEVMMMSHTKPVAASSSSSAAALPKETKLPSSINSLSTTAQAVASRHLQMHSETLSSELSRMLNEGGSSFLCDNCGDTNALFFCFQVSCLN